MPLGGADTAAVLESLARAAPFFRRRMAQSVKLRRLPALSFELDGSFDNAQHIYTLLRTPSVSADVDAPRDTDGHGEDDGP